MLYVVNGVKPPGEREGNASLSVSGRYGRVNGVLFDRKVVSGPDSGAPTSGFGGRVSGFAGENALPFPIDELRVMASEGRLRGLRAVRLDLVEEWLEHDSDAETVCRRLTAFNRSVTLAVLEAHVQEFPWLEQCTFLEFGSGGRDEHVVGSDQDNGLIIRGDPDPDDLDQAAQEIVVALDGAGLPLCPGGVMISNPEWRGNSDEWLDRLSGWLANPGEKGPWQSGLFLDFLPVFGPAGEALALLGRLRDFVRTRPMAIARLADELTDYRLPLSLFGSFITEKSGPHAGTLDIKHSVLAHITNAARILSLKHGLPHSNTCDRIRRLAEVGHISEKHGRSLLEAWNGLQRRRLVMGLSLARQGLEPHCHVNPNTLSSEEKSALKDAIRAAEKLVRLVQAGSAL